MQYIIYTRCSTEEQRKKGYSHDYQIDGIKTSPKLAGATCIAIYSDTISGTTFERPQLQRLLEACKDPLMHQIKIYVYRWDRFGRDVGDAFLWIRLFASYNIEVNCIDSLIDYADANWPVLLGVTFGIAQSESLKISDRTRDGIHQAIKSGYYIYSAPYGYRKELTSEKSTAGNIRKILVPHPEESALLRRIFKKYLTTALTRAELYDKYQSKLNIKRTTFYTIFERPVYAGYIKVPAFKNRRESLIKARHQGIISKSDYDLIQIKNIETAKLIYSRSNTPRVEDLYLKNILHSPQYSLPMTAYYSKGRKKHYGYYESKQEKGSLVSASKTHQIVDQVISNISLQLPHEYEQLAKETFLDVMGQDKDELTRKKFNYKKIADRLSKLSDDYLSGEIKAASYSRLSDRLEQEKNQLDKEIQSLQYQNKLIYTHADSFFEHLIKLPKLYRKASNDGKLRILRAIFPSGFSYHKSDNHLRTAEINKSLTLFISKSAFYELVKTKKGTSFDTSPLLGERPHAFRTDFLKIFHALTA